MTSSSVQPARRVAIIGGGITGLTAAYDLTRPARRKRAVAVTVFEGAPYLGGLAAGFKGRRIVGMAARTFLPSPLFLRQARCSALLHEIGFRHALKSYQPNTAIHHQGQATTRSTACVACCAFR
jgi:protoporphyrinogen oxidase